MGEVSLGLAVDKLGSEKLRERSGGLEDLKRLLQSVRGTPRLDVLEDDGFHSIFEALFRFVRIEKALYARGGASSSKSATATRLASGAATLRLAVEIANERITSKTVNALLDHVLDSLPTSTGLCEPLAHDYCRCLRLLLENAAHTEHLRDSKWQDLVEFIVEHLSEAPQEDEEIYGDSFGTPQPESKSSNGQSISMHLTSRLSTRSTSHSKASYVEDLMFSLSALCSFGNHPVLSQSRMIKDQVIGLLRRSSITVMAQQGAFCVLNMLLTLLVTEDLTSFRSLLRDCIPIIRRIWNSRSTPLREEMTVTLMFLQDLFRFQMSGDDSSIFIEEAQALYSVVHADYTRRQERDLLHSEEVAFFGTDNVLDCSLAGMEPDRQSQSTLGKWMVVSTMATLLVQDSDEHPDADQIQIDEDHRSKRPRLTKSTEKVIDQAIVGSPLERIAALQIISFALHEGPDFAELFKAHAARLLIAASSENTEISSWTLLAFSSFASLRCANGSQTRPLWTQVFQTAARFASSITVGRAACHLLDVMTRGELVGVSERGSILEHLLAGGMAGPGSMTDSALQLCATLLPQKNQGMSSSKENIRDKVLAWVNTSWHLATITDKVSCSRLAHHAQPAWLTSILLCCTTRPLHLLFRSEPPLLTPIIRKISHRSRRFELIRYLAQPANSWAGMAGGDLSNNTAQLSETTFKGYDRNQAVVALLNQKIRAYRSVWISAIEERASNATRDLIRVVATACLTASVVGNILPGTLTNDLCLSADELWNDICTFIAQQDPATILTSREVLVSLLFSVIPAKPAQQNALHQALTKMMSRLQTLFEASLPIHKALRMHDFGIKLSGIARDDSPTVVTAAARLSLMWCSLHLENAFRLSDTASGELLEARTVTEYLLTLDTTELLGARHAIIFALSRCTTISRDVACDLLERVAQVCLQDYALERSEIAQCLCLEIMESLTSIWAADGDDDLSATAFDIYSWFMQVGLGKNVASNQVIVRIASMLRKVLDVNANFARSDSDPSPRTHLFMLLERGSNIVRYYAIPAVSEIFGHFVLTEHDKIFDDIIERLPTDPSYLEGIALRLFVLTELACKWRTLLRRSIYHLFEAPGLIPECTNHARYCITRISDHLGIDQPQQIFQLFAPQILYTWLQSQSTTAIPFQVFGFPKLSDLVAAVLDEIVAQAIIREDEPNLEQLTRIMALPQTDLIKGSFAKVEAYCISRDIGLPRSKSGQNKSIESATKKRLGSSTFLQLVQDNFPSIVANMFLSTEADVEFEKALLGNEGFNQSQAALEIFRSLTRSQPFVASNQQPTFRAKYLLDELAFVCRRANVNMETMWTPALVVSVCRRLLDAIVPALGSLHACSVLRKLCFVMSLAGPATLTGYPLEMLLHAIQPFLFDFHCSQIAMSIARYLMTGGRVYLETSVQFFCGFIVNTFVSLLRFLDMPQDSTTPESHFKAAMTDTQNFHAFLSEFALNYRAKSLSTSTVRSLTILLEASSKIRKDAVAINDSHEGNMVMILLESAKQNNSLLTQSALGSAIRLLSENVSMPDNIDDDILEDDLDATEYAPVLIHMLQHLKVESTFKLWASKIIGRAFASCGRGPTQRDEHDRSFRTGDQETQAQTSGVQILEKLRDLLFGWKPTEASIAERTLQTIITGQGDIVNPLVASFPSSLREAFSWEPYIAPPLPAIDSRKRSILEHGTGIVDTSFLSWSSNLTSALCILSGNDTLLVHLPTILTQNADFAVEIFPYVVHGALSCWKENANGTYREELSTIFTDFINDRTDTRKPFVKLILETIIYLRSQPIVGESTISDRERWLDIDFLDAARACSFTNMHEMALLCLEIHLSRTIKSSRNRRSSLSQVDNQLASMHEVFENLEDPDFFYGVPREPSLESLVKRLGFEKDGLRSLSFESARIDAAMHDSTSGITQNAGGLLKALNTANLQGLAYDTYASQSDSQQVPVQTALSLRRWELQPIGEDGLESQIFRILQHLHQAEEGSIPRGEINDALVRSLDKVLTNVSRGRVLNELADLTSVTELSDVFSQNSSNGMLNLWQKMGGRIKWMNTESLDRSKLILTARAATFSAVSQSPQLAKALNITRGEALLYEVQAVKQDLAVSQAHEALQAALNSATYLSTLAHRSADHGLELTAVAELDLARVLWQYQEMPSSIQILKQLSLRSDLTRQTLPISRLEILAEIGHHVAEARLEKPEEIQSKYLLTAIREVKNSPSGEVTGRVYHEFAAFCDKQLQNAEDLDDYKRVEKLRDRKEKEVQDLEKMVKEADGKQRDALKVHHAKAKQWLDLDDREYKRLKKIREGFLEKCLSNYLLCLRACDDFEDDVLRFVALWLDQAGNPMANTAVESNIRHVPSRKFAPLMNQLSSRLLDDQKDAFQKILFDLIVKICSEHPFHGMYQIFASSKWKGGKDEQALSRHAAANRVAERLRESRDSGPTWISVHNSNISFVRFAVDRLSDTKLKSGSKTTLGRIPSGSRLEQDVTNLTTKIPPPTMKIMLRADCDYSHVPRLSRFEPNVSIAGGVSAPKIVTAVASDGSRHKQLFKGGNDDLRQDAIMEQVFEQVSNLLRRHRSTRQRNLGIRTYRVLPLTANAGIIEFVQNTIPLHDYLLPAHQRHFPKDMKPNHCRRSIADVQNRSVETRVSVFKKVTEHFQPVMRFFFMERFMEPSEWFQKRLNYSRSTAAISILGHVLGLGDRHGHNILLDEESGEVVHIDLGVAFEAGRVLPVPEVVPFRLTRDLVDGMGVTGTEGPFRRCCNFTLEALRQDSDSIMTILDVLRYDPLYSWSVSPLRMKRMQEEQQLQQQQQQQQQQQDTNTSATDNPTKINLRGGGGEAGAGPTRRDNNNHNNNNAAINEPSEADRALTVVAKKLGKSLSVEATVNELIQQATDERNLAVLYCGWAAYA